MFSHDWKPAFPIFFSPKQTILLYSDGSALIEKALCKFFQTAQVNIDKKNCIYASPEDSGKGQYVSLSPPSFPIISTAHFFPSTFLLRASQLPDFCEGEANTWITNLATITIEFLSTLW